MGGFLWVMIAILVAFWAVGLTGILGNGEEVKILSAYASCERGTGDFTVHMELKNTGLADATLDDCFINDKPYEGFGATSCQVDAGSGPEDIDNGVSLPRSGSATVTIIIPHTVASKGQTLDIRLHTAAGRGYPRAVVLP